VFPEETVTDADGNTMTRPSAVGVVARAVVQPMTSTEDASVGFVTTSKTGYAWSAIPVCSVLSDRSTGKVSGTRSMASRGTTAALVGLLTLTT
jgi:hypothetical protein